MIDFYKWRYYAKGAAIYCIDNNSDVVQAMCASAETARVFVNILNDSRLQSQRLEGYESNVGQSDEK